MPDTNALTPSTSAKAPNGRRDPGRTRTAILEVAGKLLARDGPEGLSVSQVAQIAGVNRGTAYHHFQTREQLLTATMEWVSQRLCEEVFGDTEPESDDEDSMITPRDVSERLINFVMDNPEFGPAWMHRTVILGQFEDDAFWKMFKSRIEKFAKTEMAEPDIDVEVHTFMVLLPVFMWPLWANSQSRTPRQRKALTERFMKEAIRAGIHGTIQPDKFPDDVLYGSKQSKAADKKQG